MIKRILIGVDDSETAQNAAKYGFKLAESIGAQVALVHMVSPMATPIGNSNSDPVLGTPMQNFNGLDELELLNAQDKISETILSQIAKKYGGKTEVKQFHEYGSTAEGIISCCEEYKADMIILGTHHRSGFDRLLMGSVAEDVVRYADIPVLVVPSKAKG